MPTSKSFLLIEAVSSREKKANKIYKEIYSRFFDYFPGYLSASYLVAFLEEHYIKK